MATALTGQDMLELLESIVDDSVDETVGLFLLNTAKDQVEMERRLEILKAFDTSKTAAPGDSYLTAKALPSAFIEEVALYVGDDPTPWNKIPFEQREQYKDVTRYWYIDHRSGNFHICGGVSSSQTLKLCYKTTTDDIASGTSPTWPAPFHKLIVIRAAELFYPADAGERGRSWDDKWKAIADRLEEALMVWDAQLKVNALNGARSPVNFAGIPNIAEG